MPAKRNKRVTRKTEVEDWIEPENEEFELAEFIESVGPSIAHVYIHRIPKHGDQEYKDRVTVADLAGSPEEFLRERFGAGKYKLSFRGSDHRWKLQKIMNIGTAGKDVEPALNGATNAAEQLHLQFLREQLAQQQTLNTALIQGLAGRPAPDPAAMLTAVVAAFSALHNGQPKENEDWIARAKTIIELARDLQPSSGTEDNPWSVVKDFARQLTTSIPAMPSAPPAPAPPPMQPANGQQQNVADWIRVGLNYLKHKAALGKDPDFWVDWILTNEEEPQCAALAGAVQQGATLEHLLQFDPEIAQQPTYVMWFRKLYDGLYAEIHAPVDSAGSGGNTDHASHDAGPGAPGSAT
jgi:hypothetical protein